MVMKDLIRDLARIKRMLFVVGGGACVSEMYCDGETEPEFHGEWSMVESESWHLHMNVAQVKSAQFVEAEDHGAPVLYFVRFADEAEETLLRAYFPNPYLDDNDKRIDFQPEKLKVFEELRDRYAGQPGVVFVKRPKEE